MVVRLALALAALVALGGSSAPAQRSYAVYLVRGEQLAPVRRSDAHGPASALAALLRGPSAAERREGYSSAIPAGTRLRGVQHARGVLSVDLDRRFESGGGSLSMLLRVAQVVHTATQFDGVARIAFRLDGRAVTAIGGEGVIVSPPVGRGAFEGQAPPILVERPLPHDVVSTPLVVSGTANVFEARFFVDVRTRSGALLARRPVSASAGTGTRGRFAVTVALPRRAGAVVVSAYERSARDGSRIHVVRVPVTLP